METRTDTSAPATGRREGEDGDRRFVLMEFWGDELRMYRVSDCEGRSLARPERLELAVNRRDPFPKELRETAAKMLPALRLVVEDDLSPEQAAAIIQRPPE